jgi:battenin
MIHTVPYALRIPMFALLSFSGMLLIALTPASIPTKLVGIVLASLASGAGELSFLGLTHFYGPFSLAAWGSGTGGAGLVGAGLYVAATSWLGLSVRTSLLVFAFLPVIMLVSFFGILPRGVLSGSQDQDRRKGYEGLASVDIDADDEEGDGVGVLTESTTGLLGPSWAPSLVEPVSAWQRFQANICRSQSLFVPYMVPLLLVYVAEYTINQGVAPTLLFPLVETPFAHFRDFYPFYNFLYQVGVFVSRSSTPFFRIHRLYVPALLQVANLGALVAQSIWGWAPNVWIVFVIVFWEGLLGGAVYVNTFAEIMEKVPKEEREFSLGATSVSDSGGICIAGFVGMALEVGLCEWQVRRGIDWCRQL